jgi:uncharacterized protein (TIRG00374 family)
LVKLLLKIAVSAALIAFIVRAFDLKDVGSQLARVDVLTLMATTTIGFLVTFLHTARWCAVLEANGTPLHYRSVLRMVLIGLFFNQALPSSVGGDAVRVWCANRAGLGLGAAARTVIIDRGFTLLSLLAMSGVCLPWLFEIVPNRAACWTLAGVVAAGIAGFLVFVAIRRLPRRVSDWRLSRALLALSALARSVIAKPRIAAVTVAASVAGFAVFSLIVFLIAHAMRLPVTFGDCLLLVPPIVLVTVLPVSIGGWGVREGAMVVAFGYLGVPAAAAFAMSVLFALTLAVANLPGAVLWWHTGYHIRNIDVRLTAE